MILDAQIVGGLQAVAGVLALALLKPAIDNPDTPGSKGYALLTVGTALWMFSLGWSNFVTDYALLTFGYHFLVLGTELAAAGWLFLALFATNRTNFVRHTALVVGAGIVLLQLLLWTNPLHNFMYQSGPGVVDGIIRNKDEAIAATFGWWWIHVAASYLLVLAGEAFLLWEWFRSTGIRRKQFGWLSLTFVPLFIASVVSTFGLFDLPYNVSSVGFLLALPFLTVGLFRTGFLDIVPVARRTATAELDAAMVTLDNQDRVVDANRRARELFDSGPDYVGTDAREFFTTVPDDVFSRLIDSDDADGELTVTVEGQQRHFSISTTPIGERTTRGRVVLLHDITSQKQHEEELEQLNTRLELALEETDTGVWSWNLSTDEVQWDETSERLFGYDAGTFSGTFEGFANRVPEEDLQRVRENVDHAIETGEQYRADFRVQPPTKAQRWLQARGIVKYDGDGEPEQLLGIQTDITERKEREEELRKREQAIERTREQLRQIIDLVPDPLFVKNIDDEVLLSNEANAELHGMTPEELEGQREFDIEPDVDNIENFDKFRQREKRVIETGESTTFEEELRGPDGETYIFKITRIPFKTTGTDEDAVLGYARDVTDLKEYEQELEETKRTLEKSNEKLDQFAGIVSHDLRNPLNAAQLRLDLLRREKTDEHIDEVEESLDRMQSMIEDLLLLSRAGEAIENSQQVSLVAVATESWEIAQTEAAELELLVDESTTVRADRDRLRHVFENLFRNAVDHNDSPLTARVGLLDTSVEPTDDDQRGGFFVEDDGDGIPEDEYDDIFSHGYTTSDDGTGFGLSIVEDVVGAHGWTISVAESDEGGARFEITGVKVSDQQTDSWY
jgi:PAS domain S-box-containing protein